MNKIIAAAVVLVASLCGTAFGQVASTYSYSIVPKEQVGWASDVTFGHVTCMAQKAYFQPPSIFIRTTRLDLFFKNHDAVTNCVTRAFEIVSNPKYKHLLVPVFAAPPGYQGDAIDGPPPLVGQSDMIQCGHWPLGIQKAEFFLPYVTREEVSKMFRKKEFATCISLVQPNLASLPALPPGQ